MGAFSFINEYAERANPAATIGGGVDAHLGAFEQARRVKRGMSPLMAAQTSAGSRVLGAGSAALSGHGLMNDYLDIDENGLTPENSRSAVTNGTGLASYVSSLLPGTTASVASPAMAAFSGGLTLGAIGDEAAADYGWSGTNGRSYSDWSSDVGADAYEAGGHWLGIPATLGTSIVGGIDSIATGAASIGESLVGRGHIMDDVQDGLGMNLLLRSVAQGVANGRNGS